MYVDDFAFWKDRALTSKEVIYIMEKGKLCLSLHLQIRACACTCACESECTRMQVCVS